MTYAEYYAQKTLITHNISKLPLECNQITNMIREQGFEIVSMEANFEKVSEILKLLKFKKSLIEKKAFTVCHDNINIVFYSSKMSAQERILAFAHELGHINMGHISESGVLGYNNNPGIADLQEIEANDFALELLAPVCILKSKRIKTTEDLENIALVSHNNSTKQFDKLLHHKRKYTEHEKELLKLFGITRNFSPIIKSIVAIIIIIVSIFFGMQLPQFTDETSSETHSDINSSPAVTTTEAPVPVAETVEELVYVTKTGTRYHKADCRYVRNNKTSKSITAEEAKTDYTPCKVCNP